MRIEVRLYATLADAYSNRAAGLPQFFTVKDKTTLRDLFQRLHIPVQHVQLAIINGRVVHEYSEPLAEGDRIALFPPIGGG